jgi:hypothetical protein
MTWLAQAHAPRQARLAIVSVSVAGAPTAIAQASRCPMNTGSGNAMQPRPDGVHPFPRLAAPGQAGRPIRGRPATPRLASADKGVPAMNAQCGQATAQVSHGPPDGGGRTPPTRGPGPAGAGAAMDNSAPPPCA